MLIIRVRAPREGLSRAVKLAKGFVVGMGRDRDGRLVQVDVVLREESAADALKEDGIAVEVLLDSRTRPNPRDGVSKGNRYTEELDRLKAKGPPPRGNA
jgi:hypothetical protein